MVGKSGGESNRKGRCEIKHEDKIPVGVEVHLLVAQTQTLAGCTVDRPPLPSAPSGRR